MTFVSKASVETGSISTYNLRKRIDFVRNCRNIGKKDMKYNDSMPKMKVDPETYVSKTVYFHDWRDFSLIAYECRSSKQMGWFAKQSQQQTYHWRRSIMFTK